MTLDPRSAARANTDARSALGIRPGARPTPRVVIDDASLEDIAVPPSPRAPPSPTARLSTSPTSRHISIAIPSGSHASPVSPVSAGSGEPAARRFRRPTLSRKLQPASLTANRGLYETQKLLSHLLDRLEAREAAPDVLDRAAIAARELSGRPKGKAKSRVKRLGHVVAAHTGLSGSLPTPPPSAGISSEDAEDRVVLDEGEWDTDEAADLVEQTRGLLVLAERQGLDLFGTVMTPGGELAPTPTRARKMSRFSSVASPLIHAREHEPAPAALAVSGATLLYRLTALLRSLVTVDCIHRAHLFRPLRPPNALQAACLDIATYLYHKGELETRLDMLEIVTDGLYGMGEGMAERICEWLEGRLGELLGRLAADRSGGQVKTDLEWNDPFAAPPSSNVPTFAFSSEPPEEPEVPPPSSGWRRYSPTSPQAPAFPFPTPDVTGILSTHAADHFSAPILRIAALVPRILVAIATTIDLTASKLTTIYRVHRLLSLILTAKPDAPLDLLEIIAQAPGLVRRRALDILATFYPESTGHNVIARRPALATYAALRSRWESGQERALGEDDVEGHHYVPWRATITDGQETRCSSCEAVLQGFCVRCTMCSDVRHLHCHQPPPDQVFVYDVIILSAADTTPHTVHVKFSKCLPRLEERVIGEPRHDQATVRRVDQHELHLVHVFNLTLCEACHKPVWSATSQAYACMAGCQRFFHPTCADDLSRVPCRYGREVVVDELSDNRPSNPFTIEAATLRASFDATGMTRDVAKLSYDEAAVHYAALWVQHQLVKNGVASGSLRTLSESRRADSDVLGLRKLVKQAEAHLAAAAQHASTAALDFVHVTAAPMLAEHDLFWSPRYLAYCAALLRAPAGQQAPSSPGLSVNSGGLLVAGGTSTDAAEAPHAAYETVPMALIRRSLAVDVNMQDERAAALFLDHLRLLGLCAVPRRSVDASVIASDVDVAFALPLLMDSSPTVELLILAVEALLDDLDLTANEHALALLSSRAWPSLLCSPYALERLSSAVIGWIVAEDDVIHRIVKDYASKRRRLPGVRAPAGPGGAKSAATVGMYKDDRRRLLARHAAPWLAALHAQDTELYAHVAYEQCKAPAGWHAAAETRPEDGGAQVAGLALERLAALTEAGVIFSVMLDLLTAWLEDLGALAEKDVVYKSLPRLLGRQDAAAATDTGSDALWALAAETSAGGPDGLARVCRWMRVLSYSGAEVPWASLEALLDLQAARGGPGYARLDLTVAIAANTAAAPAEHVAHVASRALAALTAALEQRSTAAAPSARELDVLRQALALVLRAHGVPHDDVAGSLLAAEAGAGGGPYAAGAGSVPRRKRTTTLGRAALIPLDTDMVLSAAHVLGLPNFPTDIMLDFFWLLFTRAQAVDNVGGFLHHMCGTLYEMIWPLYDRQVDRRRRARLFLKLLTINTTPIEQLVQHHLEVMDRSTIRERLLTFALELADAAVTSDVADYHAPAVGLLLLFFESLLDAGDTADASPDALVVLHALMPTHLAAAARCFEERLTRTSDAGRLDLLGRLGRLRAALPSWPIISWRCIEELLVETVTSIGHLRKSESNAGRDALHDAEAVRSHVLALGLDMLAAGIDIQWPVLHRFQQHVASACATPWPRVWSVPAPPRAESDAARGADLRAADCGPLTVVLPALRQVLDAPTRVAVSGVSSAFGEGARGKKTALVGSLFVPVVVDFAAELAGRDFVTQRAILDIMLVLFFKVQTVELSALSTLQVLADHAAADACGENRLLALHVLSTALRRMPRDSAVRALSTLVCAVARVLDKEQGAGGDAAVAEQARALLQHAVTTFRRPGLFLQLFQADNVQPAKGERRMSGERQATNSQGPSALGKALVALNVDTAAPTVVETVLADLSDLFKRGRQAINEVLRGLEGFVAALEGEVSDDAVHSFGAFVTRLGKHIGEYGGDELDPNPILRCCALMLPLAPLMASTALLHQTSTLLHLALARFAVLADTVTTLAAVAGTIAARQQTEDTVRTVLLEQAGAAVNGLQVAPATMQALLRFLRTQAEVGKRSPQLIGLSPGCITLLLRSHPAVATGADAELTVDTLVCAADLVLCAEAGCLGNLSRVLTAVPTEAAAVQLGVHTFLLYASLSHPLGSARHSLTALYPLAARATSLALRAAADLLAVRDASSDGAELLNASFAVTRLVVLAAREPDDCGAGGGAGAGGPVDGGDGLADRLAKAQRPEGEYEPRLGRAAVDAFWERVWPDWNRLLLLSLDATCVNGPLRAVTHAVVLDTVVFVAGVPPLVARHRDALDGALAALSAAAGAQAAPGAKWARAAAALARAGAGGTDGAGGTSEARDADGAAAARGANGSGGKPVRASTAAAPGPADVARAVRADMLATERLRVLRASL